MEEQKPLSITKVVDVSSSTLSSGSSSGAPLPK
jgi:hypothetical protein